MSRNFYAVEYKSGRNTTTGQPNSLTGNYSIACNVRAFASKKERDNWVLEGASTSAMRGNCREEVTLKEARELYSGMNERQFKRELGIHLTPRYRK